MASGNSFIAGYNFIKGILTMALRSSAHALRFPNVAAPYQKKISILSIKNKLAFCLVQ
jgi:hypothetical protein